jgi:hypothetical protein
MKYENERRLALDGHWTRWLIVLVIAFSVPTAATAQNFVTSVDGEAIRGDQALSLHDEVEQGELVETSDLASCSLLLSDGAVIQACNKASLRLRPGRNNGTQIIDLSSGEIKASVGPQPPDDPLEIHTPAAIATILGTTLHVRVDPETGDTTITSLHNRIRVESSDPSVEGSVTIEAGEEVVIRKGSPPEPKRVVDIASMMTGLSDCLDDESFRAAAVRADRERREAEALEFIVAADIPDSLPPVGSGGGQTVLAVPDVLQPTLGPGGPIDDGDGGVCQSTNCGFQPPMVRSIPIPTACSGTPGEQCTF